MKVASSLIIALLMIVIAAPAFASAVLVDAKGAVTVKTPDGKTKSGVVGQELAVGTTVAVGANASAAVMDASGTISQIDAGGSFTVGAKSAKAKKTDLGEGIGMALREMAAKGDGPTVHAMVREAKGGGARGQSLMASGLLGVNAIAPTGTVIRLSSSVLFRWDAAPKINWANPVIVIDDANKKRLAIFPIEEGATQLSVNTQRAKLSKGGTYSWYFASRNGGIMGKSLRFEFATLSAADEKKLDADIAKVQALNLSAEGRDLLVAQLYFQFGLRYDMVELLKRQPKTTPFTKKLLVMGYNLMGRPKEAAQYEKK